MVRYIPDPTGRFAQRPFYTEAELDRECEGIVNTFLAQSPHRPKNGQLGERKVDAVSGS